MSNGERVTGGGSSIHGAACSELQSGNSDLEIIRTHKLKIAFLVAIICVEGIILLGLMGNGRQPVTGADTVQYNALALNLKHHSCFSVDSAVPCNPIASRTPGYPLFLTTIYIFTNDSLLAVRLVQFGCLALTSIILFRVALFYVGEKAAFYAALLTATYPPLVCLAEYHLTETLSTLFLVGFLWIFVKTVEQRKCRTVCWGIQGLILGCATMVRPALAILVIVPMIYAFFGRNKASLWPRMARVLAVGLAFSAAIMPWAARNYQLSRAFIPLGDNGGSSLWMSAYQYSGKLSYRLPVGEFAWIIAQQQAKQREGQNEQPYLDNQDDSKRFISSNIRTELAVDRKNRQEAAAVFRGLHLRQFVHSIFLRIFYLWGVGDVSPQVCCPYSASFHRFVQVDYLLLAFAVITGIALCRRRLRQQWPLWIVPTYLTLIHLVYNAESRYTMPARPFLAVYAGFALCCAVTFAGAAVKGAHRSKS